MSIPNTILAGVLVFFGVAHAMQGATFTVITEADADAGSLRQAILDANANPGPDRIVFSIPGTGVRHIALRSDLPDVSEAVEIDGSTQPGHAGAPVVSLEPARVSGTTETRGLRLTGTGITVRALAINSFYTDGSREIMPGDGLVIAGPGGNRIVGCAIGISPDGTISSAFPGFINRGTGILIDSSPNNIIGGSAPADANVVVGYSLSGNAILINGPASTGTVLQGNRINMNSVATRLVSNAGRGIVLTNAPGNTIGGVTDGARNYIYGNDTGLLLAEVGSSNNLVQGNWFGLKPDGTSLLTESDTPSTAVRVRGRANTVGGTEAGARNVMASGGFGIIIDGDENVVAGNFVGTDPTGKTALRNSTGIRVGGHDNRVGGIQPGSGNLISGNGTGARMAGSNNVFQGNLVGTDITGLLALPNGKTNSGDSSVVVTGSHNLIGGSTPGARNVISGNDSPGVDVLGPPAHFNRIEGNWIGLAADGLTPLGNRHRGIQILGANDTTIGGNTEGAGNEIAYNPGAFYSGEGVFIGFLFGDFGSSGSNNVVVGNHIHHNAANGVGMLAGATVRENSIHDNGKLAIDRLMDGPTANVARGAHNYPVITSARQGSSAIEGTFEGKPNAKYRLDFYNNTIKDPLGYGELERHLGSVVIKTDASGKATYNLTFEKTSVAASWISATATEILDILGTETEGETSEAAINRIVDPPVAQPTADLAVTVEVSKAILSHRDTLTFRVHVTNLGPDPSTGFGLVSTMPTGWNVLSHAESADTEVTGPNAQDGLPDTWVLQARHLDVGKQIDAAFEVQATGVSGAGTFGSAIYFPSPLDPNLANNLATIVADAASIGPVFIFPPSAGSPDFRIQFPTDPWVKLQVSGSIPGVTQPEFWQPVPPALISPAGGNSVYTFQPQIPGAPPFEVFRLITEFPELPHIEINQLSLNLDNVKTPFSDWGTLSLRWKPQLDITYLNAKIGDSWSIQNVPLVPVDGPGVEQVIEIPFRLGTPGTPVLKVPIGIALSAGLQTTAPITNLLVGVRPKEFQLGAGENLGKIVYAPAVNPVGGAAGDPGRGKPGFPNREQGTNECAPSAILNSLQYLDVAFNLGLPRQELTIEKIKDAVKWAPAGAPVGADIAKAEWVKNKREYMRPHGLPINTDETGNIGIAINALNRCYDVEMRVTGHVVCVRAIVPLPNNQYVIVVSHDVAQGRPGGTVVEGWIYDQPSGHLLAPGWAPDFRQFVVEYPDGH